MKFVSLFSGSSGNCLYLKHQKTTLIIDAGLSGKRIEAAFRSIEAQPDQLSGILVTHEHSDHIQGVGVLSRRYDLPVFATQGTWRGMAPFIGKIADANRRIIERDRPFAFQDLEVTPFSISHDAMDPVGYVIDGGHCSMAVATDTGVLTPEIRQRLLGHDLVVLESNHDLGMLETGSYPFPLKQRIKSDIGHLSNTVASEMACTLVKSGVTHLVLAHLSAENNLPLLAYSETEQALKSIGAVPGQDLSLEVASRHQPGSIYEI